MGIFIIFGNMLSYTYVFLSSVSPLSCLSFVSLVVKKLHTGILACGRKWLLK